MHQALDLPTIAGAAAADARHALRRLRRDWPFSAATILILGLGIGANTAMFSVINAVLIRAPQAPPDQLVDIYQNGSNPGGLDANSYPAYLDMADYTDVFSGTTAVSVPRGVSYQDPNGLRPAIVEHTTASYPSVVGVRPALGRWFSAADDTRGAPVVAVISHRAWTRKFNADPSIVGRSIRIDGTPAIIVGVGPAGYNGTLNIGIVTDFWLPISSMIALGAPARALDRRPEEAAFFVKARLRDRVSVVQARAAMQILGTRLAAQYPNEDPGKGITVMAAADVRVHPQMDAALRWMAAVLGGVVGLVLALACSNLATLILVRGAARTREVSVRLALGATRGQLIRHLLVENMLLSIGGGAAGCVVAWWTAALVDTLDLPIGLDVRFDYHVFAFSAVLSLATGVAFGLAPAINATRIDLVPALRHDGEARSAERGWFTLKNALVLFQVAVSVALVGVTAIVLQVLNAARSQPTGFAADGVVMLQTDLRYAGYSAAQARNTMERLRGRVASIAGVRAAVAARGLPMDVTGARVVIDGTAGPAVPAGAIWAGSGFFDLLGIPIAYGRAIDERDRAGTPRVAVISEVMARQYFGAANAVGRRFRPEQDADWFEVIGVARNTGTADVAGDLVDPTPQLFYRAFAQADAAPDTVLARTALDSAALAGAMQRELRAENPALPVIAAKTMAQYLEDSLAATRVAATLLAGLGALGLGLAGIGLYAVVAFRVSRRSREIGIRMALGARSAQVVWTVTKEVAVLLGIGTGAGLLLTLLAVWALRAASAPAPGLSLYRPSADPLALAAIAAFMGVVGVAAASMPTWRAARMDPLQALRRE